MNRRHSSRRGGAPAFGHANHELTTAGTNSSVSASASTSTSTSTLNANPSTSTGPPQGLPKAASVSDDEGEDNRNYSRQKSNTQSRASWYEEALQQGNSAADLDNILESGKSTGTNDADHTNFGAFDDNEVLEQYRIMAQHEAYIRVKESTGFDIAEYEKRRKMQGNEPTDKRGLYGGNKPPKPRLPELKKFVSASGTPKPEEPPLPNPNLSIKILERTRARIPELCPGVTVRGGTNVRKEEHIVRCLGCRGQVRVNLLATLVSCPECNTVSPASSSRR